MDMEMTGLDPDKEVIIEVAAIVANNQHEELECLHRVVKQDSKYLEKMDAWNTHQHKKSGLSELVPKGVSQDQVEQELMALADKHFKGEKIILAGNSIYQDRLFIKKHMPKLEPLLHHRMLDVSSWKIIFTNMRIKYKKHNKHRALDDVRESIKELKEYISHLKTPSP